MVEAQWFAEAFAAIKAGVWPMRAQAPVVPSTAASAKDFYEVTKDGVAVLSLQGPLMKPWSKYGGTSTVFAREKLREAVRDSRVRGIMLHIDSPGGTVAGTHDLALETKRAALAKPLFSHIDDLGASAAYWVASQANRVTANATAMVGSIGTYSVVHDFSKQADLMGIEVHVVSTGEYKGAGEPGTKVTEEQIAYIQDRVNDLNEFFIKGVVQGRNMERADVDKVADGRVFIASKARAFGLIDKVTDFDNAYTAAVQDLNRIDKQRRVNADVRGSRI